MDNEKKCPSCKEFIAAKSVKCKFCGSYQSKILRFVFSWSNILAFVLSTIAIFTIINSNRKIFIRTEKQIQFIFTNYNDDILHLTFLNNSGKQFYLEDNLVQFIIKNVSNSSSDTIFAKLESLNTSSHPVLINSKILKFKFINEEEMPCNISLSQEDKYVVKCELNLHLYYSDNRSIKKDLSFDLNKNQMELIIEELCNDSGS